MDVISSAVTIFFTFNAFGNIPLFIFLLREYGAKRRLLITFRETTIALLLMILFGCFGKQILNGLNISITEVRLGGGVILLLIAFAMMFPRPASGQKSKDLEANEPFIVPLAIPILTGPGTISTIMVYASQQSSVWFILAIIFIAWTPSMIILMFASYLQKLLGERILVALERLMGMILTFIAVEMFGIGLKDFLAKAVAH